MQGSPQEIDFKWTGTGLKRGKGDKTGGIAELRREEEKKEQQI